MDFTISDKKKSLKITWKDGHQSLFHALWLRFNCHCHDCRGEAPGCYKVDITKFPEDLFIDCVKLQEDGKQLHISFEEEPFIGHVTIYKIDALRKRCYCDDCLQEKVSERNFSAKTWMKSKQLPTLDYNDASLDEEVFYFRLMKTSLEEGLCKVINFPKEKETFLKVVQRTGDLEIMPFSDGYYDEVSNVNAVDSSGNTCQALPFHMDYKYTECNGQFMFFNCIRFDKEITGGESSYIDLFEIAEFMRREYPEDFKALCEIPILRECITDRLYLVYERPCISVDYHGQIVEVAFAGDYPPLLQVHDHNVGRFFKAYRKLNELIESKDFQIWLRYEPGTMVVFHQRRLLHTRTSFKPNGGVRTFGVYSVTAETMRSRYMLLARKLGKDVVPVKLGNKSSF